MSHIFLILLKFRHKLGAIMGQFVIFACTILFVTMGFATAIMLIETHGERPAEFETFKLSFLNVIAALCGIFEFKLESMNPMMIVLYVLYCLISVVCLTRMLVSLMTTITIV